MCRTLHCFCCFDEFTGLMNFLKKCHNVKKCEDTVFLAYFIGLGETGASCNTIYQFKYCTSVDCPFETFLVPK